MKNIWILLLAVAATMTLHAQESGGGGGNSGGGGGKEKNRDYSEGKNAFSIQALKMGAVAFDYERYVGSNIGLQGTAGLFGFEMAVKFHFKPSLQSSSIGLSVGNKFKTVLREFDGDLELKSVSPRVGLAFEYRAPKLFTFSVGGGIERTNYYDVTVFPNEYNQFWWPYARLTIGLYMIR